MRACEQIRTTVAYPKLNVKLIGSHAGVSAGSAGVTHHAIEDIAIMRSIPNMVVLAPGDACETRRVITAAIKHDGPVYIRLSAVEVEDVTEDAGVFSIGKALYLRSGDDATIVTTGVMVHEGLEASRILARKFGISMRLLHMPSIKPIDRKAIMAAINDTGIIVTVEEHSIIGGLGSAVSEIVAETGKGRVARVGINDHFCGVGSYAHIKDSEGLTVENIVATVRGVLKKAKKNV
jgi:transketolase